MKRNLLIGLATVLVVGGVFFLFHIPAVAHALTTVMSDNFESYTNGATITDATTYNFANFPGEGTGNCCGNPSTKWEMDTGSFIAKTDSSGNEWGYLPTTDLYRLNTQQTAQDAVVTWTYKASVAGQADDVWLRFQSQYWTYALQYDRSDGCIVAKRKVPTNTAASGQWLGPSNEIANDGVYYVLRVDPGFLPNGQGPCNQDGVQWTQLGTTTAVDDATLNGGHAYNYKATITTIPAATCGTSFDCVQLTLYRGGVLIISWTDKNNALSQNSDRTVGTDCANHFFDNVTGFTPAWCLPIYSTGKSGLRNDENQDVWIDNFTLADATSSNVTPDVTPPSVPTNLTATPASTNQVNLAWSASTDPTVAGAITSGLAGYKVLQGGAYIATTTNTTYSATGLSPSTSYTFTVKSYDAAGNVSAASTGVSTTTKAAPSQIIPKSGNIVTGGFININGDTVNFQ